MSRRGYCAAAVLTAAVLVPFWLWLACRFLRAFLLAFVVQPGRLFDYFLRGVWRV